MDKEEFDQIKSDVLKKHYDDRMHYSMQPGNISGDIKNGIRMVLDVLDYISLEGSKKEVLEEASRKLYNKYSEFCSLPAVQSDKIDKHGFTCAVLKRCAEDFEGKISSQDD